MKRINKLLLNGCGYSVLILTLFYIFAAISKFTSLSIAPGQFALILSFGMIISLAEFLYESLSIKTLYKNLIHYFVLLAAFCVIFIISGNIKAQNPSVIFVATVIYTLLYFTVLAIVHFVRRAISSADDRLSSKTPKKKEEKKQAYKSLYKDDE